MRIYIASYFDTRERLFPIREQLQALGHEVTAQWLDSSNVKPEGLTEDEWYHQEALRDLRDVASSDMLILDTFDVTPRGGREVELGYALVVCSYVWMVGPTRNVFHQLVRRFETWEECINAIRDSNRPVL